MSASTVTAPAAARGPRLGHGDVPADGRQGQDGGHRPPEGEDEDMGRVEERARVVDVRGAEVAAAGGPVRGTARAGVVPEGRAVWPLAAAPGAPSGSSGRSTGCAAACRAQVVEASPRLLPSRPARVARAVRRALRGHAAGDGGAATAEYAIATMAAVAFAGLLVVILQSDEVRGMLLDLVRRALTYDR